MPASSATLRLGRAVACACAGAALVLLAAGARAQDEPKWDRLAQTRAKKLSQRWWKARPPTKFDAWDEAERADLEAEARQFGALPEGVLEDVVELLWEGVHKYGPGAKGKGRGEIETPYGDAWFMVTGKGKDRGLILGLHGGGENAGDASEPKGTWKAKDHLGMYPQAIRLISDTWNTVQGERFLLTLIEIAKAQHEIDPDRVYAMGFSMGGTGSWFLAGRHPDLLAGAAPCAGVLMASPKSQLKTKAEVAAIQHGMLPNVRNLAIYSFIGLEDTNCMPGTFLYAADRLAELAAADEGGYTKFRFESHPGLAHAYPKGEPDAAIEALTAERRDTFPQTVVWEYATDPYPLPDEQDLTTRLPKRYFYWLKWAEPADNQLVRATRAGNTIDLELRGTPDGARGLTLLLNDRMIDPAEDVVVTHRGEELYRGRPQPDFWTVLETLDAKLDRTMVFDRRIEL